MNFGNSKLSVALSKSNRCHNEKYMERLLESPALKYDKELNYIYITLPRGEEHLVDRKCVEEYYSWLTEYLNEEIDRLKVERDTIKLGVIEGSFTTEQKKVFLSLLINPSDEQIQNMVGFNPRKDTSLVLTDNKLLIALRRAINNISIGQKEHDELIKAINVIYKNRINKVSDLIVKYENVLMKMEQKINNSDANKRLFNLKEEKIRRKPSKSGKKQTKKNKREKRKKTKNNNNNNRNQN